jgi:hypothetical protein
MENLKTLSAQWARLGFRINASPSDDTIDIEKLIVKTSIEGGNDPTIFWGMLAWVVNYGDLINVSRLSRHLDEGDSAVIAAVLDVALSKGADKKLANVLGKCRKAKPEKILFHIMETNKITAQVEKENGLDIFKKWGLYCSTISDKSDALHTRQYVLDHNFNLFLRALFGANIRAEILFHLSHVPKSYIKELSRLIGMSYQPVHAEVERMALNKILEIETIGKLRLVSLNPKVSEMLHLAPAA